MAQMISEAVNRYAAGCLASGFSAIPYLTAKKTKNMTFTKTVNGQAIYCRIVKALAKVSGHSPDQRIKGDEIPLQGHR